MTDVDCKLTVLVAACTLCGFCLLLTSPAPPHPTHPHPILPLSPFSLSASRLSYSFSAGKVKCCLLHVRSEGAQGSSAAPHPPSSTFALWPKCFLLRAPLCCHQPAVAPAVAGPGCRGMCLSPVVSSLLSCSQLLQVDLFSTHCTERGPRALAG